MNGPLQSNRGRGSQLIDGINITPMVDVILVILVIFMVATTLIPERQLPVNLPTTSTVTANQARPDRLTVTVDAQGAVYLEREPGALSLERLADLLNATARVTPNIHIDLRADRERTYGEIIEVLQVIRTSGISSVGFAVAGS